MTAQPDIRQLRARDVKGLSDDAFRYVVEQVLEVGQADRAENQILYYRPASERAEMVHLSSAKVIFVSGGNGSSKTETCLAEIVACATGKFPEELAWAMGPKFRGPLNCRVIVESLTTTLHPIILPKLKWWVWTGVGQPGSGKGHWGWVPKTCLIDGSWEKSWSQQYRMLKVKCFDPKTDEFLGLSTIQFMSHDQDPSDFASGDFHIVMMDEPPREPIWTENEARTMRVNGRIMLAMTWPDDPAMPVDWIHDKIYDRAKPGGEVEAFELHTTENPHLDQVAIASQMARWSETERQVRIYGKPIRFSNLIHPDFIDRTQFWCFNCKQILIPTYDEGKGLHKCDTCQGYEVISFNHVREFDISSFWPVVCVLDPHPRKPHMLLWAAIDPSDDIWIVADLEKSDDPGQVKLEAEKIEERYGLVVANRIMDPNMGKSPSRTDRETTWQDEFSGVGMHFNLAEDSDVGRGRVNAYLKPDKTRMGPRMHFHVRCEKTIGQMKRYTWDEHKKGLDKEQKQKPRQKHDDYPTMLKYLLNSEPTFRGLRGFGQIIHATGKARHEHGRRSY